VFTQASLDTTRKHGGTGLGLAICKKLLNIMNSEIQVDSTVGLGTSFYFSLTLGLSGRTALTGRNTFSEEELEGLTVLIVEDFEMNIRMLARFFDKWGISYDIAENGRIACEKAEAKNYDLILMDLQMPEMDGYEATSIIRKSEKRHNKWVPIAAFTASAGLDVKEKIRRFGMNLHISKPFNPMDLYQVLKEAKHFRPLIHE
jgi:CheY-like chemotaxis protein